MIKNHTTFLQSKFLFTDDRGIKAYSASSRHGARTMPGVYFAELHSTDGKPEHHNDCRQFMP